MTSTETSAVVRLSTRLVNQSPFAQILVVEEINVVLGLRGEAATVSKEAPLVIARWILIISKSRLADISV